MKYENLHLYFRLLLNNISQIYILLIYKLKGNSIAPNFIKRKIIDDYVQKMNNNNKYKLKIFVETGTYLGQTIKYFLKKNYYCFSIELNLNLFIFNKFRFKKSKTLNLLFGDSKLLLNKVIEQLQEPCIFFLDAHASGGVTSQSDTVSALREELEIISNFKYIKNSLLIIDDVRGLDGTNSYPSIQFIMTKFEKIGLTNFQIRSDMLFISSKF